MKTQKIQPHQLQRVWERAIEEAQANTPRAQNLDNETINAAAGLRLQSGVKAGGWTHTYTDAYSCGCP